MCGYCHYCATSIACEYVVRNVDRNFFTVYGIYGVASREYSRLLFFIIVSIYFAHFKRIIPVFTSFFFGGGRFNKHIEQLMLRSYCHICNTVDRIYPRCKNFEVFIGLVNLKFCLISMTFTYPIALHLFYLGRPIV